MEVEIICVPAGYMLSPLEAHDSYALAMQFKRVFRTRTAARLWAEAHGHTVQS